MLAVNGEGKAVQRVGKFLPGELAFLAFVIDQFKNFLMVLLLESQRRVPLHVDRQKRVYVDEHFAGFNRNRNDILAFPGRPGLHFSGTDDAVFYCTVVRRKNDGKFE